MWIAVALGLAGYLLVFIFGDTEVAGRIASMAIHNCLYSFTLTCLPLFILMGEIVAQSGIGKMLVDGFSPIFERLLRGGLLHATVMSCSAFGAVCGSAMAGSITIGKVALPGLKERNYNISLSLGAVAAGGPLSIIIPPSGALIIFGALTGVSIAHLFIAGIIPGITLGVLLMIAISFTTWKRPDLVPPKPKEWGKTSEYVLPLLKTLPTLLLAALVLYSIYGGIATPTEVAAVGVLGATLIGLIYQKGRVSFIWESLKGGARLSVMLLFLIVGAMVFSFSLDNLGFPHLLHQALSAFAGYQMVIIGVIFVIYIVMGLFIDGVSILAITTPLLYPVFVAVGFDPLWIGITIMVLLGLGNITPPVGLNLFAVQSISGESIVSISKGALPFMGSYIVGVALLVAFPSLATWLPGFM